MPSAKAAAEAAIAAPIGQPCPPRRGVSGRAPPAQCRDEAQRHRLLQHAVESLLGKRPRPLELGESRAERRIGLDRASDVESRLPVELSVGERHQHFVRDLHGNAAPLECAAGFRSLSASARGERRPGARQPAHDRPDRDVEHLGGLAVAQILDADEDEHVALLLGQRRDLRPHLRELQAALRGSAAVLSAHLEIGVLERCLVPSAPVLVDPEIVQDAVHPAVEPRARLPGIDRPQRPLAGALHEIVRIVPRARQPARKAPQPGKQRNHLMADIGLHMSLLRSASR